MHEAYAFAFALIVWRVLSKHLFAYRYQTLVIKLLSLHNERTNCGRTPQVIFLLSMSNPPHQLGN